VTPVPQGEIGLVFGVDPFQAGLWTMRSGAAFVVGSLLAPQISRRLEPAYVMAGGLTLAAVGFGILSQIGVSSSPWVLALGYAALSLGLAPVFTTAVLAVVLLRRPHGAGSASGSRST
jgi:MFS transporter, DHA2 family, multidrug resistance protein